MKFLPCLGDDAILPGTIATGTLISISDSFLCLTVLKCSCTGTPLCVEMLYLVLLHYELSKSLLWNGEYWVFLVYVTLGQKSFPQICNKPNLTALNDLQRL